MKGFMKIPGVDYTEYYSPVAKDSTIRTAFAMTLYHDDWVCHMVDVEAALLNPVLKEPMYIEWPDGAVELGIITQEEKSDTCIKLV